MKKLKAKAPVLIEKVEFTAAHRNTWRIIFEKLPTARVKEISILGLLEFVPGRERGDFMDEVYRVLIPEGKATVISAYWTTANATHDYLFEFPPLSEQSFLYFNKGWRESQKLQDRGLKCDFDFTYGYGATPETASKNDEARSFSIRHYNNTVQNLQLVLTKRA